MKQDGKKPGDVARTLSARSRQASGPATAFGFDGWRRETFTAPRDEARDTARDWFRRFPKAAYMSEVESWRELADGRIEFTMRRLHSAD